MSTRRDVLTMLAGACAASQAGAQTSTSREPKRVGVLHSDSHEEDLPFENAFLKEMRNKGWPEQYLFPEKLAGGRIDPRPQLDEAAKRFGFETRFHPIRFGQDIAPVLDQFVAWGAQAITGFVGDERDQQLIDFALAHRLPCACAGREYVQAGALLSYAGAGFNDEFFAVRSAGYVDRILRGARPQSMPIEFPTNYELVINAKTAKALGVVIPESLLLRAEVI